MPVEAYHPRWFMHCSHMDVDESVDAFLDLGGRFYIPMQWGAFALGDEPAGYPAIDLKRTIESKQLDPSEFKTMDIGAVCTVTRDVQERIKSTRLCIPCNSGPIMPDGKEEKGEWS